MGQVTSKHHTDPEELPFKVFVAGDADPRMTRDVTESFAPLVLSIQKKFYNVEFVNQIDTIYFLPDEDRVCIFRRGKATPDSYRFSTDALKPLMNLLEEKTDPATLHILVARAISSIFLAPFMTHENNIILQSTDFNEFKTDQDEEEAAMVADKMQGYCCGMDLFLLAVPFELNLNSKNQEIIVNFEQLSTTNILSRKRSRESNEMLIYDAIKAHYVEHIDDTSATESESEVNLSLGGTTGYILDGAKKIYEFEFLENALRIKSSSKKMEPLNLEKIYPDLSTMKKILIATKPSLAHLNMLLDYFPASNSITARAVRYLETLHLESNANVAELRLNPKIQLNGQTSFSIFINDFDKSNIPLMDEKIYDFVIHHGPNHASDSQMRHFIATYLDVFIAKNQEKMRPLELDLRNDAMPSVEKINELTEVYTEDIIAIDFKTYCNNPVLRSFGSLGLHREAVEDICDKLSPDIVDYFAGITGVKHSQLFFQLKARTEVLEKLPRILLKSLIYRSVVSHVTNSSQDLDLTYSVLKETILDTLKSPPFNVSTSGLSALYFDDNDAKPQL